VRLPILEPKLTEQESAYRAHFLRDDIQTTCLTAAVTLLGALPFALSDYRLFGPGPLFFALFGLRLVYTVVTLAFFWRLSRVTSAPAYERLTLAWALLCVTSLLLINASRPPSYFLSSALDLMALFGLYLFVPNRLTFRLVPALALTAGELILATWLQPPAAVTQLAVWATFGAANVLGLAASVRLNRFRRAQYRARLEEARIRQELQRLANTDPLTGVFNRRRYFELAQQEFARQRRYRRPLALLVLDLDHFKLVNDQHGHQAGDAALRGLADLVCRQKRAQDVFGRLGGEEFALLLPETTLAAAQVVAERLLAACAALEVASVRGPVRLTFSGGITQAAPDDQAFEDLLYRADQALYRAKAAGRNRIESDERPAAPA
jgi:diguanylate cyclase (GGDEF)-like protein